MKYGIGDKAASQVIAAVAESDPGSCLTIDEIAEVCDLSWRHTQRTLQCLRAERVLTARRNRTARGHPYQYTVDITRARELGYYV